MLNEIRVVESEKFNEKCILTIPRNWWTISSSYPILNVNSIPNEKLKVLRLRDFSNRKPQVPKPNYWDITQGDYFVQEESNSFYKEKIFEKKIINSFIEYFPFRSINLTFFPILIYLP